MLRITVQATGLFRQLEGKLALKLDSDRLNAVQSQLKDLTFEFEREQELGKNHFISLEERFADLNKRLQSLSTLHGDL